MKNIFLNIIIVLLLLVVSISLVFTFSRVLNPLDDTFFGYRPMIVSTDSMEPVIMTGALVIGKSVKVEDVSVGDIITFSFIDETSKEALNSHKVIKKEDDTLWTQGVNLDIPDNIAITNDNLRYKVVSIYNSPIALLLSVLAALAGITLLIIGITLFIRKRNELEAKEKRSFTVSKFFDVNSDKALKKPAQLNISTHQQSLHNSQNVRNDFENQQLSIEPVPNQPEVLTFPGHENTNKIQSIRQDKPPDELIWVDELLAKLNDYTTDTNYYDLEKVLKISEMYALEDNDMNENYNNQINADYSDEKTKKLIRAVLALKAQNEELVKEAQQAKAQLTQQINAQEQNFANVSSSSAYENKMLKEQIVGLQSKISELKYEIQGLILKKSELETQLKSYEGLKKDNQVLIAGARQQKLALDAVKSELEKSLIEKEELRVELAKKAEILMENDELKKVVLQQLTDLHESNTQLLRLKNEVGMARASTNTNTLSGASDLDMFNSLISEQKNIPDTMSNSDSIDTLLKIYQK